MGEDLGSYNHINVKNIDNDPDKEIVLGSSVLYQFNVPGMSHTAYLPLITGSYGGCHPLFADDFSDPGSGWPSMDTGATLYEYLNGQYRILVRNANWWAGVGPDYTPTDFILSVDVRNATAYDGSYGLIFGLANDWSQFYTFEISSDGLFGVWRYDNTTGWTALAYGSSTSIYPGMTSNRLEIERNRTQITASVNGQVLASGTDSAYMGARYVGLIVTSFDQPNLDVRFDNFLIEPLICGSEAVGGAASAAENSIDLDAPGVWDAYLQREPAMQP